MTSKKSIPTNQKETLDYMDDSATQLDEQRLAGLQEEQTFQLIKDEILQREKKRLEAKHGNSHPAVQEAESRTAYNKQMFTGLKKEIDKASIRSDSLPTNAWRVHGRVFENEGNPVKGVTVFLSDQNKRWIEVIGNSCTNELGYYSLTVDEKQVAGFDQKQPLFLTVSNKNKEILYVAKAAIFLAKGFIDLQDIYLLQNDCTTPPDHISPDRKLTPDAWVVKGKVTDENDKGLQGLTVSLYDKDLFFDDALGTTITDKNGNFELIYRTDSFEFLFEKKPDIYLTVLDNKGKKLFSSNNKVRPGVGRLEEFDIKIENRKKE